MKVIITSKFWRSVLTEVQNCDNRINDLLIIGSPLDVAIAADAKFDILLAQRSSESKLKLILGRFWRPNGCTREHATNFVFTEKIESIQAEKFVIICNDRMDLDEMATELERAKIDSDCVNRNRVNNDGKESFSSDGRLGIQFRSNRLYLYRTLQIRIRREGCIFLRSSHADAPIGRCISCFLLFCLQNVLQCSRPSRNRVPVPTILADPQTGKSSPFFYAFASLNFLSSIFTGFEATKSGDHCIFL